EVLLTGEEAQIGPAAPTGVVADRALEYGVALFQRVQHRALGHRPAHLHHDLRVEAGENAQVVGQPDSHVPNFTGAFRHNFRVHRIPLHTRVCTSTDSTDGSACAAVLQLSPESEET